MISKEEIDAQSEALEIHTSHVQRDYVFGWVLYGIYTISDLKEVLILKGGNAFRKAYFAMTRFSNDLDFSTQSAIDPNVIVRELVKVSDFVREATGVEFVNERARVEEKESSDTARKIYQARLYFKDFYGKPESITISIRLDIAELDRIYLPVQDRLLIHPYSDASECRATIKCIKLEELLATKLKCLLQRRHLVDLYDYVYAIFVNKELEVSRQEIVSTFFKKTIFERSPGAAMNVLLGLPLDLFREVWAKYIACPVGSLFDFNDAVARFADSIRELFGSLPAGHEVAFFPATLRNPILEAGSGMRLLSMTYKGVPRVIEPYSLVYKRRQDGYGQEYFYGYDRTGGASSPPGIKSFVHLGIGDLKVLEETFSPRFTVELGKAGELGDKQYFGRPFGRRAPGGRRSLRGIGRRAYSGIKYVVECFYCGRQFQRSSLDLQLKAHKDRYGNPCFGRAARYVGQKW